MANELALIEGMGNAEGQAVVRLARYADDAQGAFAANTVRALRSDIALFTAWCAAQDLAALPAAPHTLAAFIDAMDALKKKPATIRRYVSSVAHLHRAAGLPSPAGSNPVTLALRRMRRKAGVAQLQADGITRRLADRLLDASGRNCSCRVKTGSPALSVLPFRCHAAWRTRARRS